MNDAYFMNGCTSLPGSTLLVCESATGRILAVDQSAKKWRVWLADQRLAPSDPQMPGANGIKVFGDFAYISVTDSNTLYRVKVHGGEAAGPLEILAENLRADDFAFAASGALYIATHPAQSVMRLARQDERTTIAGPDEGLVGSTACAFGKAKGDEKALSRHHHGRRTSRIKACCKTPSSCAWRWVRWAHHCCMAQADVRVDQVTVSLSRSVPRVNAQAFRTLPACGRGTNRRNGSNWPLAPRHWAPGSRAKS